MQIDLANWIEIISALIALICFIKKPNPAIGLLVFVLFITVAVEFTSKFLSLQYSVTKNINYITIKWTLYAFYVAIKFPVFLWIIYFFLKDNKFKKLYIITTGLVIAFVIINLLFGQGFLVYNNFSNVFGIFILVLVALFKLKQFENYDQPNLLQFTIISYLFMLVFYFVINMPFFIFFHQMFARDTTKAIVIYRLINDSANYLFYLCISIIAILFTKSSFKEKH